MLQPELGKTSVLAHVQLCKVSGNAVARYHLWSLSEGRKCCSLYGGFPKFGVPCWGPYYEEILLSGGLY